MPTKMQVVRRLPLVTLAVVGAWTVGGLVVDRHVGHAGQLALGVFTAGRARRTAGAPTERSCASRRWRSSSSRPWARSWARSSGGSIRTASRTSLRSCRQGTGSCTSPGSRSRRSCEDRATVLLVTAGAVAAVWGIAGVTVLPDAGRLGHDRLRVPDRRARAGRDDPSMRACSWSSWCSSCTARRSARGRGSRRCRGSVSRRAIHRAASRAATSSSTSSRSRSSRGWAVAAVRFSR